MGSSSSNGRYDSPVNEVLSRLSGVRSHADGKGWEARCPAHDDQRQSLGVSTGRDGQVMLFCGANCTFASIVDALGMTQQQMWPRRDGQNSPSSSSSSSVAVAVYDYKDESGALRFQCVRYLPKRFSQRRPLPGGPVGHYVWGLKEGIYRHRGNGNWTALKSGETIIDSDRQLGRAELCLYRLPEILSRSDDEWLFIVEGEKDADALRAVGLAATCSPMGAGKWRQEYAAPLRSRKKKKVCVIPDNDDPGRRHAEQVAASLSPLIDRVVVLSLPGVPEKGDVSDWLAAGRGEGGASEQLVEMAEECPAWTAAAAAEKQQGQQQQQQQDEQPIPAPELIDPASVTDADVPRIADLRKAGAKISFLWENWIQSGVLNIVAAVGGVGKTRLCADLVRRIRHGMPWPDGAAMTMDPLSQVLWVVADNHHDEMVSLAEAFAIEDNVRISAPMADVYGGTNLDPIHEVKLLEARIKAVRAPLVIIDTVGNATDRNLSRQEDAKAFYEPLQRVARRCRAAILCLTHLSASGGVLGRRATEKVRSVIRLDCPDPEGQPNRRKLEVIKTNSKRPAPLGVTMLDGGLEYNNSPPQAPDAEDGGPGTGRRRGSRGPVAAKLEEACDWLGSRLAAGPARVSQVRSDAERQGYSAKTLYAARDEIGVEEEEISGRKWWRLPQKTNHDNDDDCDEVIRFPGE